MTLEGLKSTVEIDDSEENLKAIYEDDLQAMEDQAQRDSSHILVVVDEGTDETLRWQKFKVLLTALQAEDLLS